MKRRTSLAMLFALGLAACTFPQSSAPPSADELATRVSGTLTAIVPPTPFPTAVATIAASATAGENPTASPAATATAAASATPIPTDLPSASPTPSLTPTLPADDPRAGLGDPTFRDRFATGANWPLGEDSFTRAEVEDGRLILTGLTTTDGWRVTWPVVRDFYLELTAELESCSGSDRYGLMARVPDLNQPDRGYLFGITCDGRYSLRAWDSESMTTLVPFTANPAILAGSGQANRIGLMARGEELTLYANGVRLAQVDDQMFTAEGSFGIFIGARQTSELTLSVSEIAYWVVP